MLRFVDRQHNNPITGYLEFIRVRQIWVTEKRIWVSHCVDGPGVTCHHLNGYVHPVRWCLFGRDYYLEDQWRSDVTKLKRVVLWMELRRTIKLTLRRSRPVIEEYWAPEGKGGKKHKAQMETMITEMEVAHNS